MRSFKTGTVFFTDFPFFGSNCFSFARSNEHKAQNEKGNKTRPFVCKHSFAGVRDTGPMQEDHEWDDRMNGKGRGARAGAEQGANKMKKD